MKSIFLFTSSTFMMLTAVSVALAACGQSIHIPKPKLKSRVPSKREIWLSQARVNITPNQFWIMTFFCALVTFLVIFTFSKTPLVASFVAIGSAWIPFAFISKKRVDISKEVMNSWPDALRDISASISAGQSLSFALRSLAKSGPAPIAPFMTRFAALEKTVGFKAALEIVREEMNDSTTDRIIEVLIVANESGGKIIREIIDDLIEATTEDIALGETIATESLEMKINSRAVVIIPWCVLILLTLSGGIFRDFYQSSSGAVVLTIGAAMSILGIFVLSKLARTEIESRVFSNMEVS